jgi:benzoyl-CoA reductase/2-hydroxyglutaryl-CoA dehydratase subunit BcrC/BadD/HgdB
MNKTQRNYGDQLRQHIISRVNLPEAQILRMKIDALSTYHYLPDSEIYREYIKKARKYSVDQRLEWIKKYVKEYDLLLRQGFSPTVEE